MIPQFTLQRRLFHGLRKTCSCPSTTECYHILAAKMAIGTQEDSKRGTLNLTQLCKNSRPRNSKTSGRKRPRPGDCDIVPAPDAAVKQQKSLCGKPFLFFYGMYIWL